MNKEIMYGYPLSSILVRICIIICFFIIIIYAGLFISTVFLMLSVLLIPLSYLLFKSFKNHFLDIRIKIINKMLRQVQLNGNEKILDLGTGSGYAAIPFAQSVPKGLVVGVDKYNLKNKTIIQRFQERIKINFLGNTLHHALENTILENVTNNMCFVKTDLIETMPFTQNAFNVILSSQFLYCIPNNNLNDVLCEIDRVLSDYGYIIFFESIGYKMWDIKKVQEFFEKKGYKLAILPIDYLKNKCILVGRKQ